MIKEKNKGVTETTVCAFIFYKRKLLLIKHKRTGKWLPVGGHVEKGEILDVALKREIKEEVNLQVGFLNHPKLIKINGSRDLPLPFHVFVEDKGTYNKLNFDFICRTNNINKLKVKEDEINGFRWFSKKEILKSKLWKPIKTLSLKAFEIYPKKT